MYLFVHGLLLPLLISSLLTDKSGEIFQDLALKHGFTLSAERSDMIPVEIGVILSEDLKHGPQWRLAQWGTRFNLKSAPLRYEDHTTRSMSNQGKTVIIYPGGLAGKGVMLSVKGGAEYDGNLRQQGEPWPHVLIEHKMPRGFLVSDYAELRFHLEFRVDQCRKVTGLELIRSRHSAQITAFFSVHNTNKSSKDFRDMIWFGLPLFDARVDIPGGHQAVDVGKGDATGKFICTLDGRQFYDSPTGDGTWKTLDCDLVELMREALAIAQARGSFADTTFDDLHPSSFNLGWEVTGPYDCAITLKGLSLKATAAGN